MLTTPTLAKQDKLVFELPDPRFPVVLEVKYREARKTSAPASGFAHLGYDSAGTRSVRDRPLNF